MATRKQRRRREKEQRHEYEVVYVDSEGNEVEQPPEPRMPPERRAKDKPSGSKKGGKSEQRSRGGIQPPSWRRSFRRGLIFAPIFAVVILIVAGNQVSWFGVAVQTVLLFAVFVPFSYFMDRLAWRLHLRRLAKQSD